MIKVKLYSIFREVAGKDQLNFDLDNMTVKEVLDHIFNKYIKSFKERKYHVDSKGYPSNMAVCVNGKMLKLDEESLYMKLKAGDVVHILEIVSGG